MSPSPSPPSQPPAGPAAAMFAADQASAALGMELVELGHGSAAAAQRSLSSRRCIRAMCWWRRPASGSALAAAAATTLPCREDEVVAEFRGRSRDDGLTPSGSAGRELRPDCADYYRGSSGRSMIRSHV